MIKQVSGMNSKLRTGPILILAILLLLPGVYGMGFSLGISNGVSGASENFQVCAGPETAFASSIEASPQYYSNTMRAGGVGGFSFDETFDSLDKGEHVRLIAQWSDSANFNHGYTIEKQENEQIRASQSMTVDEGKEIESSALAWNSLGQSAKVGIKIPEGSLKDYSNYGDAMDGSVTVGQEGLVPKVTKFGLFSEAGTKYSLLRSCSTARSSRDLKVETTSSVESNKSRIKIKLKTA